uniref:Uncharacterized protein n=1 Tax=Lepeophtheirus salmonis TaxID=72036 RepID=A0A0K2TZP3_LEPSM
MLTESTYFKVKSLSDLNKKIDFASLPSEIIYIKGKDNLLVCSIADKVPQIQYFLNIFEDLSFHMHLDGICISQNNFKHIYSTNQIQTVFQIGSLLAYARSLTFWGL